MGIVTSLQVESSWTRDQTCVPCIGRQILIHSITKEVRHKLSLKDVMSSVGEDMEKLGLSHFNGRRVNQYNHLEKQRSKIC